MLETLILVNLAEGTVAVLHEEYYAQAVIWGRGVFEIAMASGDIEPATIGPGNSTAALFLVVRRA